jgi:hypothetical protein
MQIIFSKKYNELTDKELIRGTVRGNDTLYAELMRRYLRSVFVFISRHANPADAERLTGETFYEFWKGIGAHDSEEQSRRRLFMIARSLATGHLARIPGVAHPHSFLIPSTTHPWHLYSLRIPSLLKVADMMRPHVVHLRESLVYTFITIRSQIMPLLLSAHRRLRPVPSPVRLIT